MPRTKGPQKKSVHIRLMPETWAAIDKQAKAKKMAVPTFVTVAIENEFGCIGK